jgi:hypothetical protein
MGKLLKALALVMALIMPLSGCAISSIKVPVPALEVPANGRLTDRLIFNYAASVEKVYQEKATNSQVGAIVGAVGMLTLETAAEGVVGAGGSLSSLNALQNVARFGKGLLDIFKADERLNAYDAGMLMIRQAKAKYLESIPDGTIPGVRTDAGAELYASVVAATDITNSLLRSTIPSAESMVRFLSSMSQLQIPARVPRTKQAPAPVVSE